MTSEHQDLERAEAIAAVMDATKYCSTKALNAIANMMVVCFGPQEDKDGKRKEAPVRSMENTSKEDN